LPVTRDEFRQVLSHWASGIAVITTHCDGGIHGMTASSFCSLSLDPPLVLVSISKSARTHGFIAAQRAFGIHILGEGQEEFSDRCAGRSGSENELLEGIPYRHVATGAPVLDECAAWMDCRLWAMYEGGDHTICVGEVEAAGANAHRPLVWWERAYHRLPG
jgi:flavin reductase (DIM6/NTAB) family NADH-FMN oxidoreductase RutF